MMRFRALAFLTALLCAAALAFAQAKPRARDLGVPFDGIPGPNNAITDVRGVEVGHTTLISGSGKLKVGEGPIRTGVNRYMLSSVVLAPSRSWTDAAITYTTRSRPRVSVTMNRLRPLILLFAS